jgi:diguanylate cyclase (GGDEF)-like protein
MPTAPPLRMLGTVIDITERKTAQEEIERLAYYDPLTGMANRRLLLDRLRQANAHALREQTHGALLYLDLDRFKILNDSLGHHAGDILLQRVASRLIALLREEDTVARLGGDEFVVMLPSLAGDATETARLAHRIAEKIRSALSGGYDLEGHAFHISASIGIAIFPPDGKNAEELLNHADAAMYQAKSNGRDTIAFYHASLQEDADKRLAIEEELRHAIQKEQLCLHYQPQVDTRGKTIAAEALLRWQHPQRGMIMPSEFIHIAEESGLILEIGEWVLLSACQQLFDWSQHSEFHAPTVSVNVSPVQFRHADFASQVERIIKRCKVEPQRLTLEITEGMLIEDLADTSRKLETLKQLGVRISIDDFGTGYSSLYYLKHLPLDELKIDRNYVQDIVQDPDDAIIVETILAMARHLGLDVVAEGVETETQARFLREHGCQQFQGFLYARPEPVATFGAKFLKRD